MFRWVRYMERICSELCQYVCHFWIIYYTNTWKNMKIKFKPKVIDNGNKVFISLNFQVVKLF